MEPGKNGPPWSYRASVAGSATPSAAEASLAGCKQVLVFARALATRAITVQDDRRRALVSDIARLSLLGYSKDESVSLGC